MNLLVTGINGFVGRALAAEFIKKGLNIRGVTRALSPDQFLPRAELCTVGSIDGNTDWSHALEHINVVIHLAARVHVMKEVSANPLSEFLEVNQIGTENLARQAALAGVKRFIFVSSIKVNGESTTSPFTESCEPNPQDPYGISKWRAEQALRRVAQETGMEIVILRPPLVYGAGVKGNFAQMLKVVEKGIPLPFASVHNRRSLLYVGNLVDALLKCTIHPAAAGATFLVSDVEAVSTPNLLRQLAEAMGSPSRLFSCPLSLLQLAGNLFGKAQQVERLLGSLEVDSAKIRRDLDWVPPYSLQQGLRATAEWYRNQQHT